ncbi:MAG: SDR family oxidoreductase [Clostridiales bacterium]|jgi:short-subunit dehydrogenase|nr:SDR family oxidoreductase [Clostridiales bacterium]
MKITLITGATGGLGKALAALYAKDGNNLLLSGTNEQKLSALQAELQTQFPTINVDMVRADLTDHEQRKAVFAYTQEKGYFVNNLVNNAGFGDCTDFKDMDVELQMQMIQVNCASVVYFSRVFLTDMLKNNEGTILNVGSISSFVPGPYFCTYHATKSFVLNFGESVAHELRKTNVKLLTLCPGPFDSGFFGRAGNDYTCEKIKPIPAEKVAAYGYKMLKKGKRVAVVGFKNKLIVFAPRFVSRKFAATVSASMLKKQ